MKKIFAVLLAAVFACIPSFAERSDIEAVSAGVDLALSSESAVLVESLTGETVYSKNPDEKLEPASVTKVMTLLLVCEALDGGIISLDDTVTASQNASSMGGSQIWLETGEQMSADDMIKAITVVSANDCAVAMAEHIAGSEEAFVSRMNERAEELGMNNTHFSNCTGLPAPEHYTTASDIAVMTRELLGHEIILNYTNIWMDSLRGGKTELSNTNRLIRFYPGANGMKTGYTDSAKYCLSATAKRNNLQLIAVVMKAPSSSERFEDAKKLLDFGFANFSVYSAPVRRIPKIKVGGGTADSVGAESAGVEILTAKGREKLITEETVLPKKLKAPIEKGSEIGKTVYRLNGEIVAEVPIRASEEVRRAGFIDIVNEIFRRTMTFS